MHQSDDVADDHAQSGFAGVSEIDTAFVTIEEPLRVAVTTLCQLFEDVLLFDFGCVSTHVLTFFWIRLAMGLNWNSGIVMNPD